MTLAEELFDYVSAASSGIWVQTHEPEEAVIEIRKLAQEQEWSLLVWDAASGLNDNGDPLAVVRGLPAIGNGETTRIIALKNFHRFLDDIQTVQALANALHAWRRRRSSRS